LQLAGARLLSWCHVQCMIMVCLNPLHVPGLVLMFGAPNQTIVQWVAQHAGGVMGAALTRRDTPAIHHSMMTTAISASCCS
jgi:hypothetical protein